MFTSESVTQSEALKVQHGVGSSIIVDCLGQPNINVLLMLMQVVWACLSFIVYDNISLTLNIGGTCKTINMRIRDLLIDSQINKIE